MQFDMPSYSRPPPDVDLLEYKFTHDENNLYAYFRSRGNIGATQNENDFDEDGTVRAGRYYVIVTIDVDNRRRHGLLAARGRIFPHQRWL